MKSLKNIIATVSVLGLFAFAGSLETAHADGLVVDSVDEEVVITTVETTQEEHAEVETTVAPVETTEAPVVEETTVTPVVEETTVTPVVEETTVTPNKEETTVVPEQQETTVVNETPTCNYYEYYSAYADFVFTHRTDDSYNGTVYYNYNTGVKAYLTEQYAGYYEYNCYYGVWQPVYEWVWTYSCI